MMKPSGKNIIGFEFSSESEQYFYTYAPFLEKNTDFSFPETSDRELELALVKASNAFEKYRSLPIEKRIGFLETIAGKLEKERELLCAVYCLESALPADRATNELDRTIKQLRHFASFISSPYWEFCSGEEEDTSRKPFPKPSFYKKMIPIGPVAVFGASNFPFAYSTIGGDSASALAAGCPVVVKSHFMHAATGDLVAQLVIQAARETGMPDGVFSNLNSKGLELGQKLVQHPAIKAVGFTGSLKGGKALYELINKRRDPIPLFAEMGSVNPVFLLDSAYEQADLLAKISASICLNAGQFCTNPGLLFVIKGSKSQAFIDKLKLELKKTEPQVMLHPVLRQNYLSAIDQKCLVLGVENDQLVDTKYVKPILQEVDFEAFVRNESLQEEVFGMYTLLVYCKSIEDFYAAAAQLNGQLTGSLFGEPYEAESINKLVENLALKVGRIIYNGVPTGVEVTRSMHHGGPYPVSFNAQHTAVGSDAIFRFLRPLSFQNFPDSLLLK